MIMEKIFMIFKEVVLDGFEYKRLEAVCSGEQCALELLKKQNETMVKQREESEAIMVNYCMETCGFYNHMPKGKKLYIIYFSRNYSKEYIFKEKMKYMFFDKEKAVVKAEETYNKYIFTKKSKDIYPCVTVIEYDIIDTPDQHIGRSCIWRKEKTKKRCLCNYK
jgi:hypothetical protein